MGYLYVNMDLMCVVILCCSLTVIKGNTNRSENEVFAIPGCNATLEWTLGQTYLTSLFYSINVFNANGEEIAMMHSMKCEHMMIDSSMHCEVRKIRNGGWRLSVVLANVTRASSGKYQAQIRQRTSNETSTRELKIVDRPQIRQSQKAILHKHLSTTCEADGKFDDLIYHWKLNGTYFNSTKRINASSSYLSFERLTMTDKFSLFSCTVCSEINCCIESEPYAPDPYFGPSNVALNPRESDIYLREKETFKINCSADCYPVCFFRWEGFINNATDELVINSFHRTMAGAYTCIAMNPQTNMIALSKPVLLHHAKGHRLEQYLVRSGFAVIFILIAGLLILVTRRSKAIENLSRWTKKLENPEDQRISRGLQNISDQTQGFSNIGIEILPLQPLVPSSTGNERQKNNIVKLDDSEDIKRGYKHFSWSCSLDELSDVTRLVKLWANVKGDSKVAKSNPNALAKSEAIKNPGHEYMSSKLQENVYSAIDEDDMSLYDDGIDNVINNITHGAGKSKEHVFYDYADVHVTDETYITPISDTARPFKIFQDQETEATETNHTYLTVVDDSVNRALKGGLKK